MNPRVSVLLPVYNGDKYLRESIDSILSQDYRDFELLIVDDGSVDRSKGLISEYKDPRIVFIEISRNNGLIGALNKGLSVARGEYVIRMDQDDIALPMRITRQVNFMDRHPEVGAAGSWVLAFGEGGKRIIRTEIDDRMLRVKLLLGNQLIHPSVIIRTSVLNKHNLFYDPDYCHSEDYKMWLDISKYAKLANIPKVLLKYRMHPAQTCQEFHLIQRSNLAKVARRMFLDMGIEESPRKIELHYNLGFVRFNFALSDMEEWFLELEKANRQRGIYPHSCFSRALAEKWTQACFLKGSFIYWLKKSVFTSGGAEFRSFRYSLPAALRVLRWVGLSGVIRQLKAKVHP